ncbi:RHS repeat-associated core domain-containing protein [Streptomyces sp. NPDC096030]|uniref:RHS repeat domain-containing protein n=1 Tax=Streptomyces sp. NPDC096030 TaxID=3155423 RepID=UPI003328E3C5
MTAVVMAVTAVPVVAGGGRPVVAQAAGVAGAVAMGGGLEGRIDEASGRFSTSFTLVSLPGRGGSGVSLELVYDQAAAGGGADRYGMGAGMALGVPWVEPGGGRLHTASGGSFEIDPGDSSGPGLKRYRLRDVSFREVAGSLEERGGVAAGLRVYRWVLARADGSRSFFSEAGDLVAETDRFGHETFYEWELAGEQHRLVRVVDAYGQAVTFGYGTEGEVRVVSPVRSDGRQSVAVLGLGGGRLVSVRDAAGQETLLGYDYQAQGQPGRLLTRVQIPSGAVTRVGYSEPHGFPVASSVKVTGAEGRNLTAERTFSMDVPGEHEGHDFTGRGQYASADELFDSADPGYRYVTEMSDGRSRVRSVFNSLHLLKERTASLWGEGGLRPVRTQRLVYEGERDGGGAPPPASALPANYGRPVRAAVTVHDPVSGRSRTVEESAAFDEFGREVARTDVTGVSTVTEYDAPAWPGGGGAEGPAGYGLVLRVTATGRDGARRVLENTLSADRRSVTGTTQWVKNAGEAGLSARTTARFTADEHGEITQETVTWAEGAARPEGVAGPEEITVRYASQIDASGHQRTDRAFTPQGVTTRVTDLVTGLVTREVDTAGRMTERSADEAGRIIAQKLPGGPDGSGLVTTTRYTPATTTVSTPGRGGAAHVRVEERDLLGRVVKRSDNVSGGKLTGDPYARTLQTVTFLDEGRTAQITDAAGRTTVTTSDDLGRPVRSVAPNGMTRLTVYDDAATADTSTVTTLLLPAGETDPGRAAVSTVTASDSAGRPAGASASFGDGTRQAASRTSYDSLGRVAEAVSGGVAVRPSYGPGGTAESATLTPQDTGSYPGETITAAAPADLTGAPVVKTLAPGQDPQGQHRSGTAVVRDAAGRVTEERRPDGRKTTFAYTASGQLHQSVSPGGNVTSYRYDPATGRVCEVSVTSADGKRTQKTGYEHDPYTGEVTAVFNPADRDGTLLAYTYDADGSLTEVTYPGGKTVRQDFDGSGQLRSVTDTAGLTTFYTYNPDGTLKEAVQREGSTPGSPARASVTYTYDGLGRITQTARGNGVITETAFTGASQVSREKTTLNGQLVSQASYTYDDRSNLTQRTDTRPGAGPDGTPAGLSTTTTRYTYNAYSQLTGSEVLSADSRQLAATRYTLNVAGDVTRTETTTGSGTQASTTVTGHSIDTSGRLAAVTADGQEHGQTYDAEGNLLTDHRGYTYTYNLHSQPVTVTAPDGTAVRYTYWADGSRATEHTAPAGGNSSSQQRAVTFYYSPGGTLANDTHTSAGDPRPTTASYLMAGTRHARTLTGHDAAAAARTGAGYLIQDRHGNTTALTAGDGQSVQAWQYTDYGQPAGPDGTPLASHPDGPQGAARQPFTFAGEYTGTSGTQFLTTRTYDPGTGRFTTPDPAPRFNRYQAFGANPVNRIDPEGTTEFPDWAGHLIMGMAALATAGTAALAVLFSGPAGLTMGIALAGAVLDTASAALDIAATATGSHRIDSPLSIASLTFSAASLALGIGSAVAHAVPALAARFTSRAARTTAAAGSAASRAAGETELAAFASRAPALAEPLPAPRKATITGNIQHDPPTGLRQDPLPPVPQQEMTEDTIELGRLFRVMVDHHYKRFTQMKKNIDWTFKAAAKRVRKLPSGQELKGFRPDFAERIHEEILATADELRPHNTALRQAADDHDEMLPGGMGNLIYTDYRAQIQQELTAVWNTPDALLVRQWLLANLT